jgi:hypothetical protein
MAWTTENSGYSNTPQDRAAVSKMNSTEEIAEYFRSKAIAEGKLVPDPINPSVLHVAQPKRDAAQPDQSSLKIDGQTFTGTDAELNEQLRAHFQRQQPHPQDEEPARDSNGRFVSAADQGKRDQANALAASDRATLDLQFKRGEMDAATFLEKSGAMQEYLQKQGVDMNALRDVSAGTTYAKQWDAAVQEFLRGAGASWTGGEELKNAVGLKLAELRLEDQPSAASIKRAWDAVKEDADRFAKLRDAKSPAEIEEILGTSARRLAALRGGQVWGSR